MRHHLFRSAVISLSAHWVIDRADRAARLRHGTAVSPLICLQPDFPAVPPKHFGPTRAGQDHRDTAVHPTMPSPALRQRNCSGERRPETSCGRRAGHANTHGSHDVLVRQLGGQQGDTRRNWGPPSGSPAWVPLMLGRCPERGGGWSRDHLAGSLRTPAHRRPGAALAPRSRLARRGGRSACTMAVWSAAPDRVILRCCALVPLHHDTRGGAASLVLSGRMATSAAMIGRPWPTRGPRSAPRSAV